MFSLSNSQYTCQDYISDHIWKTSSH
ncbi:hypothetical protein H828_YJM1478O00472 [Saccharomyces cerevisiae YJM1478]|uniref:Arginine attenuator peptide n=11 Tax=Saccharomyces TaxID=4930 RepID=AAP_YEAST|nr:uncharacterized protein YOR302W [Saccharomyces cerevisiae S288C]P08521.1 RecName: Full=Arginine attenuator peptide; Short=AAP; AltName: Full=CPA1 leader peptide [Saccharomyces cerevisiae S288C]AAA34526.1 leader protein [Saccharomyces cerevisiae]AHY77578.1 hypothetical protein H779_YJM993O00464 [Saccharomyces cerevisiae YJM993]AJP41808.1 hypothetical protein F842_YJM1078O00465 [Saccharomyces cerevisiae YJM1078]AJT71231.1 hypothetical protein H747_YJM189O00465 [Saccharomyces cerevisiae YJM189|eukprot:NP_014946.1 hypothetical protein YOR302W [Saccharomyces cerevisiae S288C]